MREIVADQEDAYKQSHMQGRASVDVSNNFDTSEMQDKKVIRKMRLNQMINASSKGLRSVKPTIEVEEVAHQYHTLRK